MRENNNFREGLQNGIPICLGYFSVSFAFGIFAVSNGLSILETLLISMTNVTSAGQLAAVPIITGGGTLIELAVSMFVINLRYALMSVSLSQKLDKSVSLWQRFVIAFANTDEIFAVAMAHQKSLRLPYMLGLEILPIMGWVSGTVLGAVACNLMPASVSVAMNVMLYGMFIAIVVPVAREKKPVFIAVVIAVLLSCMFYYVPVLNRVSDGMSIILCTVIAASICAALFPVKEEEEEE